MQRFSLTGIGKRTAFNLAKMGAKVIMACRSLERGEEARQELEGEMRYRMYYYPGSCACMMCVPGDRRIISTAVVFHLCQAR